MHVWFSDPVVSRDFLAAKNSSVNVSSIIDKWLIYCDRVITQMVVDLENSDAMNLFVNTVLLSVGVEGQKCRIGCFCFMKKRTSTEK
uniref:Uncharacterized protein n=1 Tax=Caenorhabditis japonica TaxID=281687 RepID=A0A8R1ENH9_CAEJA